MKTDHCFDIDKLPSGDLAVRPKGQLGTIGWHPKSWCYVTVKNEKNAFDAFFAANKNWSWDDFIELAVTEARGGSLRF